MGRIDGWVSCMRLKHDAKQLNLLVVCLDINHGFMYIKEKKEKRRKNEYFYCCFNQNSISQPAIIW